jgi:hypothetical protein
MIMNRRKMADELLEARWFGGSKSQNAIAKMLSFRSRRQWLCVYYGNDKSHLAPDYERYSRSSASTRSVGHYITWFCTRISILIYNYWFRMKMSYWIVDVSCRWTAFRAWAALIYRALNVRRNDDSHHTNVRHNDNGHRSIARVSREWRDK